MFSKAKSLSWVREKETAMAEQQAVDQVAVFGGAGFLGRAIVARHFIETSRDRMAADARRILGGSRQALDGYDMVMEDRYA